MSLVPLLPIFHCFNRQYFDGTLTSGNRPLLALRWSDGRLRKTAGFYRRTRPLFGQGIREIVLSRPLLENLPRSAIESTLCHEMIHAWVDLVLHLQEGHGPNFHARMLAINAAQDTFKVSICHQFPVPITTPKWIAVCPSCQTRFPYNRRVRGAACRQCCNIIYGGKWNADCLLQYQSFPK